MLAGIAGRSHRPSWDPWSIWSRPRDADVPGCPDLPELDPTTSLPPDFVARDEDEALLCAERETGARRDRQVNQTVDGTCCAHCADIPDGPPRTLSGRPRRVRHGYRTC